MILLARAFCSKQVTMANVAARVREYFEGSTVDISVTDDTITVTEPGLTYKVTRIDKLRAFLAEAKDLAWESAQTRAKQRSCVLRIECKVANSYKGQMLTAGREGIPEVPDHAAGLVEFLGVTETFELDMYDMLFQRWLRDPA